MLQNIAQLNELLYSLWSPELSLNIKYASTEAPSKMYKINIRVHYFSRTKCFFLSYCGKKKEIKNITLVKEIH